MLIDTFIILQVMLEIVGNNSAQKMLESEVEKLISKVILQSHSW